MAARRRWSSLAPSTQRRYASRGRSAGLTGAQQYQWQHMVRRNPQTGETEPTPYRKRIEGWSRRRGLDARQVYGDPTLRPVSVGQEHRYYKGRLLIDPVEAVRHPREHEAWLYGHRSLARTVARSPAGEKAYYAQADEATARGEPPISLVMPPPGETIGHISGKGSYDSILVWLGGAHGSPVASGVVFAIFDFDEHVPYYLWWKDYPMAEEIK